MDGIVWSIDRIEAGIAVLEGPGRETREVPATMLPYNAKEGDCLRENGGAYNFDAEETARRKALARARFDKLKK